MSRILGEFAPAEVPNSAFYGLDLAIQTEQIPKISDRPEMMVADFYRELGSK